MSRFMSVSRLTVLAAHRARFPACDIRRREWGFMLFRRPNIGKFRRYWNSPIKPHRNPHCT